MTVKPIQFSALVLAGGQSSRMGTNKALLQPRPGGPTLMEIVIEKVRQAGAHEILIIANLRGPYDFLGLPIIEDAIKGVGPLGGILGGLHASTCKRNLVVACDMPNIDPNVIRRMLSLGGEYDVVVPRWVDSAGAVRLEPLHAIYSRASLPKLESCLAAGVFSLRNCLQSLRVRYAEEAEFAASGTIDTDVIFRNMNRVDEWVLFTSEQLRKGK